MKVFIGSDHGGFHLKKEIVSLLNEMQMDYVDTGAFSTDSIDYGPIGKDVADQVSMNQNARGILICGTGIGMSLIANKVVGIRAAVVHDVFSAEATRAHNDSNVLCMGERVIGKGLAALIVKKWLSTPFEGGKHQKRINYIRDYETSSR